MRHTLGLDQPLLVQYAHYLGNILRGDFGQSFKFQQPVRRVIFERYPATLQRGRAFDCGDRRLAFLTEWR
jgi:peptide/nickel transport system permease protein